MSAPAPAHGSGLSFRLLAADTVQRTETLAQSLRCTDLPVVCVSRLSSGNSSTDLLRINNVIAQFGGSPVDTNNPAHRRRPLDRAVWRRGGFYRADA